MLLRNQRDDFVLGNDAQQFLNKRGIIVRMRGLPYECSAKQVSNGEGEEEVVSYNSRSSKFHSSISDYPERAVSFCGQLMSFSSLQIKLGVVILFLTKQHPLQHSFSFALCNLTNYRVVSRKLVFAFYLGFRGLLVEVFLVTPCSTFRPLTSM
ncbi:hypothetical protein RUM43_012656 [Polyplax serrata]|uniref:Uncharacterized protein n=1 Tax=Polyplax serrata TaxID=468196 RepID=A0AAN8PJF0_POLSC